MRSISRIAPLGRNGPLAAGLVVLMLVASGIIGIFQNEAGYRAQQARETRVQAEILAASATAALDFQDYATAKETVDALRVNSQIVAAGGYDAGGSLFAGYERRPATLPRRAFAWPLSSGDAFAAVVPIARGGARIGTAYILAQREPLSRRIPGYAIVALLVLLAAMVVGALLEQA